MKLLVDNQAARAFNMQTYPLEESDPQRAKDIFELSRMKYGRIRHEVEKEILERTQLGAKETMPSLEEIERSL